MSQPDGPSPTGEPPAPSSTPGAPQPTALKPPASAAHAHTSPVHSVFVPARPMKRRGESFIPGSTASSHIQALKLKEQGFTAQKKKQKEEELIKLKKVSAIFDLNYPFGTSPLTPPRAGEGGGGEEKERA